MNGAAAKVAEASRWVATLSADEPMNDVAPWRLFCATGWHANAVMEAIPQGAAAAPAHPIEEATGA